MAGCWPGYFFVCLWTEMLSVNSQFSHGISWIEPLCIILIMCTLYLQSNNKPGCTVHVFLKNADGSQPIHTLVMQARNRIICCLSYTIYMYMYMDCFHNQFLIHGREI